jgi:hypothetical protein
LTKSFFVNLHILYFKLKSISQYHHQKLFLKDIEHNYLQQVEQNSFKMFNKISQNAGQKNMVK